MKHLISSKIVLLSIFILSQTSNSYAAKNSIGVGLGTQGITLSYSKKTDWQFLNNDQVQWRVNISGITVDDIDDSEIGDIDYSNANFSTFSLQGGIDWYPFTGKYRESLFFSSGFMYFDNEFEGVSETNKLFTIGSTTIQPQDNVSLLTDINHQAIAPYISIGWGDKLNEDSGFSFKVEFGLQVPLNDADVDLSVTQPTMIVSTNDIKNEKSDIEDDIGTVMGFGTLSITYQF